MSAGTALDIDIGAQTLQVTDQNGRVCKVCPVSTAARGAGQKMDSLCTPTGKHIIRARIGTGQPLNTIFRGRRPSGIYRTGMREAEPDRDWILTRILWLSGCEPGFNRLGNVDSMRRYIYLHGTPDEVEMGVPGSRGCIRVRNHDLLELFDMVAIGTVVNIHV